MTHASLFSGIGGFDLAAQWAGFDNLFNCEIDPFCRTVLKHHFPNAEQYTDIRATDFALWRGRVDVLTGGFPCQPFSVAGKRKGTEDERHLWPEMLRAIGEIQPRWVVGENVRGIVNWSDGLVFEQVCSDLEAAGYKVQPFVIPACGVNAPHRRDRVWFVAKNTECIRCDSDQPKKEPRAGRLRQFGAGDYVRIHSEEGAVADSSGERREPRSCEVDKRQECTLNGRGIQPTVNRPCGGGAIAYTPSLRHQKRHAIRAPAECAEIVGFDRFPTQSPVCSRDDGIPGELDGITFPKWRQESIKGYGNAIVPQIALQIMEAIKEVELKTR